jgi:FG-GAP-like repeat
MEKHPVQYDARPKSIAVGDFNNDTWLDIVVANSETHNIELNLGHSDGTFKREMTHSTGAGSYPYSVAVGDINNDQRLDIVVAHFGMNSIGILFGLGNGSFITPPAIFTHSSRPIWINLADLNNDQQTDIAIADYGTQSVSILYGFGNGTFTEPIKHSTGDDSLPSAVIGGDFNNDNQTDLVVANTGTNSLGIFLRNKDGIFLEQIFYSTGRDSRPRSIAVGDFNGDTLLDIAVANYGAKNIGVLLGRGNGTFANQTTYSIDPANPYVISAVDFNNDKRIDLIISNEGTNNIGFLLGNGDGTFKIPQMYFTGSSSSIAMATGDFNNDHQPDISVVNNDTNSIEVRLGYYKLFREQPIPPIIPQWL